MNYGITKDEFNKNGFVSKETQKSLNKEAFVMSYLKNREKSSGYKDLIGSGHMRTIVLVNFLRRVLNIETMPDIDSMLRLAYDNMDEFKKWITVSLKDKTIFMKHKEYLIHIKRLQK